MTPDGTSAQLGPAGPIVIGPTDDILAINALDYLEQTGRIGEGATVGVLTDGSPEADNALAGASWWAGEHQVSLDVRAAEAGRGPDLLGRCHHGAGLDRCGNDRPARHRAAGPVLVVTTLDGYDPAAWDADARAVAAAGRVLVGTAAPRPTARITRQPSSSRPLAAARGVPPGPRLFDGLRHRHHMGATARPGLHRPDADPQAVQQAFTTVGAASGDSLFGPSDPALPVESALPATLASRRCRPRTRQRRPA